jgi:hypothetical protein
MQDVAEDPPVREESQGSSPTVQELSPSQVKSISPSNNFV